MVFDDFNNLNELYVRIKPALFSKVEELKKFKIDYIKERDIWNYLSTKLWNKKKDLSINEMINDIFDLDNEVIRNYVLNKQKEGDLL